jgi:CheY-like chemotaxis protein
MSDTLGPLVEKALQGCATNVAPFIGVELVVGEISVTTSTSVPDGTFAVLPLVTDAGNVQLTLASALEDIGVLARHMIGAPDPDKVRELGKEELNAVGELLNLMSGAVDTAAREELGPRAHVRPLRWWRSDEPGENRFPEGEATIASAEIQIPGSAKVSIWLRLPREFTSPTAQSAPTARRATVLLISIEAALRAELERVFGRAQLTVAAHERADEALREVMHQADVIVIPGDSAEELELCRQIRLGNETWQIPVLACLQEPSHSSVVACMEAGASHVLAVPADDVQLLRVLQQARRRDG